MDITALPDQAFHADCTVVKMGLRTRADTGGSSKSRTSRSGNLSFSRRMVRCDRPLGLNASSAVGVFRWSGVCEHHEWAHVRPSAGSGTHKPAAMLPAS